MPFGHANGRYSAIVPVKTQQRQGFAPYRGTRGPKAGCRAPRPKTVCRQRLAQKPARQSAGFLYLALVIGAFFADLFAIVVSPSGYEDIRFSSRYHAASSSFRVPMRLALVRALRRGFSAARRQRPNRRGAFFHRTDGASSQALGRGPSVFRSVRPQAR